MVYGLFWSQAILHEDEEMVEHEVGSWDLINVLRKCWPSRLLSSRVSVFKFLICGVKGVRHILDCGHSHPLKKTLWTQ